MTKIECESCGIDICFRGGARNNRIIDVLVSLRFKENALIEKINT